MSNVLIGIIGVILFIGLALAGALILGDDFRTASSSSKAAAHISQISQIAHAASMYELKTGRRVPDSASPNMLVPRFLKTANIEGKDYVIRRLSPQIAYAYLILPGTEREVCASIQQTFGKSNADGSFNTAETWDVNRSLSQDTGCYSYPGDRYLVTKMF